MNGGSAGFGAQFDISISGNAEQVLMAISSAFRTVQDASGKTALAVSDAANQFNLLIVASRELQGVGNTMMSFGMGILRGIASPLASLLRETGELEQQAIGLRSAFRELDDEAFAKLSKRIQDIAVRSPFALKDVNELVQSLKNVGNVDLTQTFTGAGGKLKQSGIEFLTDLAAGAGRSIEHVMFSIRELLSGSGEQAWVSFKRRLDIGGKDTIEKVLKSAGEAADFSTPQKKLESLFKFVSVKFGGLTQSLTTSASGMVSNIIDAVRIGMVNASKGTFSAYKMVLGRILALVNSLFDETTARGKAFLNSLSKILTAIGSVAAWVAERFLDVFEAAAKFAAENPNFAKWLTLLTLGAAAAAVFGGGLLIVVGTIGKLVGIIGGLAGALKLGRVLMLNFLIGMKALLVTSALLIGIPALLYYAYRTNFGGIADVVDKVFMLMKGLFALIGSNEGEFGQISVELADQLKAIKGFFGGTLFDDVVSLFMVFGRLRQFVIGFGEGFTTTFKAIGEALAPFLEAILELGGALLKFLGMNTANLAKSNAEGWKKWGTIIGSLAPALVTLAIGFKLVSASVNTLSSVMNVAWKTFQIGISVIRGISIALAFLAANPLVALAVALTAVGAALYLLLKDSEDVAGDLQKMWGSIVDFVMGAFGKLFDNPQYFNGMGEFLKAPIQYIKDVWAGLVITMGEMWDNMILRIKESLMGALANLIDLLSNLPSVALPQSFIDLKARIDKSGLSTQDYLMQPEAPTNNAVNAVTPIAPANNLYANTTAAQSASNAANTRAALSTNTGPAQARITVKNDPQTINLNIDGKLLHKEIVKQEEHDFTRDFAPVMGY